MFSPDPTANNSPKESAATTSKKAPRVLSCVQCQQRKIKCDRQSPCANCIRSRLRCIPAPTVGPRQRRRRPQERDLVERCRYYEGLLRQHNIPFEPLRQDPAVTQGLVANPTFDQVTAPDADKPSSPSSTAYSETVSETRNIWHAMNQRSHTHDPHDDSSDTSEEDAVRLTEIRKAWNSFESNDSLLFGVRDSFVNLRSLHPDQNQIFRLWQIYMERVNPLIQVVHAPSLQKSIIDATTDLSKADPNLVALMFSIYSVAVHSLTPEECQAAFSTSQEYLVIRYQFGCQQALLEAEFPRTISRDCLVALYLYLISLKSACHIQSLSSMLGVAIRIARRMNLHIESSYANGKSTPFEAELGRRLWWSLVTFDSRICEIADHQGSVLDPTWDCKVLANVNDFDLRPEMKEPPTSQPYPTESIFVAVRSHVSEFMRQDPSNLDFINPIYKSIASKSHGDGTVKALETYLEENYFKFCSLENPLHAMTIWHTRSQIAKLYLTEHFAKYTEPSQQHNVAASEAATLHATTLLDCDSKLLTSPLTKKYEWFANSYFPFTSWMYVLKDLKISPLGNSAEQAWISMGENYAARGMYSQPYNHPFYMLLMRAIDQAWEAREQAFRSIGTVPSQPQMIFDVRTKKERAGLDSQQSVKRWGVKNMVNLERLSLSEAFTPPKDKDLDFENLMEPAYDESGQPELDMNLVAHEFLWE
ncbi:hypothetical protein K461DRAFT_328105 [Myriangium duriaei CBS 260.36]|uniref:Zn(2)-C6 fungal-type domain-containing protein n=1 Tax=Myriangium duriaei CBS 260.36 TaxID=1168546 RepID=A0A9P4MMH2_9PEZI|nr:hypothetical protein K461DRAFT_328105 [Myriangium duriaei CBS 260.36]